MNSLALVHPDLLGGINAFPPFDYTLEGLPAFRQLIEGASVAFPAPEALPVDAKECIIEGGDGQPLTVYVYTPENPNGSAILHIHGGGYVMCSAKMSELANRYLAIATSSTVISVDYRLAPETPHPGPVEDCYAALVWIQKMSGDMSIDPKRVAVRGESAGGGLAASLALLARDRNGPSICHQNLIYPMLDDRTGASDAFHPYAGEFVWTAEANRFGWGALLGRSPGGEDVSFYAAAARAQDLQGLPATYIAVGALDLFVEENVEYARRLLRAGVSVELHVYPGAYHGFDLNAAAPIAQKFVINAADALKSALCLKGSE